MLKQAREAKNLSLADVSDTTFISIRFLEAIEVGKTDILPQAYVRAFIREYAAVVGLDTAEVMRRYDSMGRPQAPPAPAPLQTKSQAVGQPTSAPSSPPPPEPVLETQGAPLPESPPPEEPSVMQEETAPPPRRDLTDIIQRAAVLMGVIVIAVVLWNVMGIERPKTREIPFQNVIKENEQHAAPARKDSTRVPAAQGSRADSLTLQAVTSDSVWVQVIIDGGPPREYLFRPNARAVWKAADKFTLTIGNASAVQLALNKKDLGILGKKGAVIQKLELTRQSLSR
jgi:cytoskeletal protein RodZ